MIITSGPSCRPCLIEQRLVGGRGRAGHLDVALVSSSLQAVLFAAPIRVSVEKKNCFILKYVWGFSSNCNLFNEPGCPTAANPQNYLVCVKNFKST